MRNDFENIPDCARLTLFPNSSNPLHSKPVKVTKNGGYYFADNSNPMDGPDYYWRDIAVYNDGYQLEEDRE